LELDKSTEAFIEVLDNHKKIIYKVCNVYCKDVVDREDLAQEITIQLWKAFPKYNETHTFSTWMYRIALNVAISHYRKQQRRVQVVTDTDHLLDVKNEGEENISHYQLYEYIHQLNDLNKSIMLLYLEDYNYKEIAEVVGISESNVGTKLHRLKQELINHFTNPSK
jgi:RNA polymerase sigma factor (sigma-70 family)